MYKIFITFYLGALFISFAHLLASAIISRKRMRVTRLSGNPVLKKDTMPMVSIMKPLKGLDDRLEENLRSFFLLDYPNYEIIFGLKSALDPALPIVRELQRKYPNVKCKLVVEPFEVGLNPKVNNLYNMYSLVEGEYIFISDSNTRLEGDFLQHLLVEFNDPKMGMVTATIRGMGAGNMASVMENLHLNTFVSPNVFVADQLSGIPIVIGKAILMPKHLLEAMGGFQSFGQYLAEDYLLGLKAKKLGYKVKTVAKFVDNINENWPLKRFLNRHTRWAKMRRSMHIHHYLIESLSNPVALSFILMLLLHNGTGVLVFGISVLLKIAHDRYIGFLMHSDLKWKHFLLVPFKDLLLSILWFVPFFSYKLSWRDNHFRIKKESLLAPVA